MELTNPLLPVLLLIGGLSLLVLLVLGWPHGLPKLATFAVRATQAIGMNLLVLSCAGALLNNQYLFYVSWGDLLGPNNSAAQYMARGSKKEGANVQLVPAINAPTSASLPQLPSPGQQVQQYSVHGPASGVDANVVVMLPRDYNPHPKRPYPVLVMMTGYPGVPRSAFPAFDLKGSWTTLVEKHAMAAPIVVIPQINTPDNITDTECVDDPSGRNPLTETWLAKDLPNWIAGQFPVAHDRQSWATIGYSYGGWCASMVAMLHPQTFGGAVAIMGYFSPQFGGNYNPLKGRPDLRRKYDLGLLASSKGPPPVSMMVMTAKNDPSAYPYMVRFLKDVRKPMSVTSVVLPDGGHNIDVIPPRLPEIMKWLSTSLPGFAYRS